MNANAQTVLLVEDNDDDVFIFRRAYKQAQLPHLMQVVTDGQEAFDYLMGEGRFQDRTKFPLPSLVLLDLKLPLKHGFEVLQAIRFRPAIASLPVVVLTSSAEDRDIERARELGAQAFFVKPPSAEILSEAVRVTLNPPPDAPAVRRIAGDLLEATPAAARGRRKTDTIIDGNP
jgi:CheY-like chemotaxis protein